MHEDLCVEELKRFEDQVFVVYSWEWHRDKGGNSEDDDKPSQAGQPTQGDDSNGNTDNDPDGDEFNSGFLTHTITFKCIGANRDEGHQSALRAASKALTQGTDVAIRLHPKPDNPEDSSAITFQYCIDDESGLCCKRSVA